MSTPSGENTPKKSSHIRHGSSGRATVVRRSTRGPLDINDPLTTPAITSSTRTGTPNPLLSLNPNANTLLTPNGLRTPGARSPGVYSPRLKSPGRSPGRSPAHPLTPTTRDFSQLLRPELYHPLPILDIAAPFRSSEHAPQSNTPLPDLLQTGHFRSAAIAAATQLTSADPPISPQDHATIFPLFYTRLSCLTLCGNTSLAAQEVLALEDLNSAYYRSDLDGKHLVPWELRVLAVRLQGMGFNDARRGVMGYYDLGREARSTISKLKIKLKSAEDGEKESIEKDIAIWKQRLSDLGIRVASALIEMEDLDGAAALLGTMDSASPQLGVKKALLWLALGNITAARQCITSPPGNHTAKEQVIDALASMAEGNHESAVTTWQSLISSAKGEGGEKAMWQQNCAVALLYLGRMNEARAIFEELVDEGHSFHALTFNLSTIYELCTERSRTLKMGLAEKISEREGTSMEGWEKVNTDFKL